MEGLSAKLKTFEDVSNNYLINMEPRVNYMSAKQEQGLQKQENALNNIGLLKSNLSNVLPGFGNKMVNM